MCMPAMCSTGLLGKSWLTFGITNTVTESSHIDGPSLPPAKHQPPTTLRRGTSKNKIKDDVKLTL